VSTQKSGPALPLIIESLAPRLILGIEGNVLALTAGLKDRFTGICELGPPGLTGLPCQSPATLYRMLGVLRTRGCLRALPRVCVPGSESPGKLPVQPA
jgi:hypothetical protein